MHHLALHADVALEGGGLLPWRDCSIYDHPLREVQIQREIRAAWADRRKAKMKTVKK